MATIASTLVLLLYRCLGMGAWSLGIWVWVLGVWVFGVWVFGNIGVWVWVFGVWVFYGYLENNCVSHADICQGMHMANSV